MDYTTADIGKQFASTLFDVIIDPVGGDTEEKSYAILAATGHYSHIFNRNTDQDRSKNKQSEWKDGRKYSMTVVKPNAAQLTQASRRSIIGSSSTFACMLQHRAWLCLSWMHVQAPTLIPVRT